MGNAPFLETCLRSDVVVGVDVDVAHLSMNAGGSEEWSERGYRKRKVLPTSGNDF
jgi:hypothetical protein